MNARLLILIIMCLWVATITAAYLRECMRRKRLLSRLANLLAEFTALSKYDDVPLVGSVAMQQAASKLEAIINKET